MAVISEVFVAGGQPSYTYVPRKDLHLEEGIRDYLDTRYKILSVSGPTKTGKTVLVRSVIPRDDGIWISAGQIKTENDFWEHVLQQTDTFTEETRTASRSEGTTSGREYDGSAKLAGVGGGAKKKSEERDSQHKERTRSRRVSAAVAGARALEEVKVPLIIDDFHYLDTGLQGKIIRALKDPIFNGVPVIVLSVPHRSFDAVRVEKEMTGRVQQLPVTFWDDGELFQIAKKGFDTLNVRADSDLIERLVQETFSSPHLMQDFCGYICRTNGVRATQEQGAELSPPDNWVRFFQSKASDTSKAAFDRLAIGPRQRSDRIQRNFKDGSSGDIYVAVLYAIAQTGPLTEIRYEELRTAMREIMEDSVPRAHEITRVLEKMTEIAQEEIEGEPVLDWDKEMSTLYIADPFFAYYLRWGTPLGN